MSPPPLSDSHHLPLLSSSSSSTHNHHNHNHHRRSNSFHQDPDDVELESIFISDSHSTPLSPTADDSHSPTMTRSRRQNNHEPSSSKMNSSSSVEHRRKNASIDDGEPSSAQQTESLLEHHSFTLDDDYETNKPASASLLALPPQDLRNFALLVLLYFLQGVPMGLAMGSVPFLLKSKLSYGEVGVFTLATYPYSMKLLWSPIVDAIWSPRLGRRKSWIVPIQATSAVMLIWLGRNVDKLMEEASEKLYSITFVFFTLVMLCATQDIAVDGAAPKLLLPTVLGRRDTPPWLIGMCCRLGAHPIKSRELKLCFHRADHRTHRRSLLVLYRLSRL